MFVAPKISIYATIYSPINLCLPLISRIIIKKDYDNINAFI